MFFRTLYWLFGWKWFIYTCNLLFNDIYIYIYSIPDANILTLSSLLLFVCLFFCFFSSRATYERPTIDCLYSILMVYMAGCCTLVDFVAILPRLGVWQAAHPCSALRSLSLMRLLLSLHCEDVWYIEAGINLHFTAIGFRGVGFPLSALSNSALPGKDWWFVYL